MRLALRRISLGFAVATAFALLAALPAFAGDSSTSSSKLASKVSVTISPTREFRFTLSRTKLRKGDVTFTIKNGGHLRHNFMVCAIGSLANSCDHGISSKLIKPGSTAKLLVPFLYGGKFEYLCTLPGHAAKGMKGILTVS